jgi:hypothetical protein
MLMSGRPSVRPLQHLDGLRLAGRGVQPDRQAIHLEMPHGEPGDLQDIGLVVDQDDVELGQVHAGLL